LPLLNVNIDTEQEMLEGTEDVLDAEAEAEAEAAELGRKPPPPHPTASTPPPHYSTTRPLYLCAPVPASAAQ
jgi:hypothetical protein